MSLLTPGTIRTILQALKIRVYGEGENNYKILCPNPLHEDTHPSCYINKNNGLWFCHSCHSSGDLNGKGNLFSLFRIFGRDDLIEKYCEKRDGVDIKTTLRDRIKSLEQKQGKTHKQTHISLPDTFNPNFATPLGAKYLKYLRLRGLRRSTISSFKLGYVHEDQFMARRILIPIYENNKLTGYQGRSVKKDAEKKYLFCKGFDSKTTLFNLDNCNSKRVLITEGVFDTMMLCQWGYSAMGIFGLYLSPEKIKKLVCKGIESIVFVLDNDEPANNALRTMYRDVFPYFDEIHTVHLPPGRDVDELTKQEFDALYDRRMRVKKVIWDRRIPS